MKENNTVEASRSHADVARQLADMAARIQRHFFLCFSSAGGAAIPRAIKSGMIDQGDR
jgi:hypothetical protein